MKQQKWRVLLSLLLAMCFCLSAFAPVYAADGLWGGFGQSPDGSLSESLSDSWKKLWDRLFGGDNGTQDDSGVETLQYRIVHLDCGRKYFSVEYIKKVIDTMAVNGFNQLELAFGNGGLRFVLDDMDIKSGSSTLHYSDKVKAAIKQGNEKFYNDPNGNYLTEAEMKTIIAYAQGKGVEIVPLLNMPGHMDGVLSSDLFSQYKLSGSEGSLDLNNSYAVDFGTALLKLYVDWFRQNSNSKFFNFGADEYGQGIRNPYIESSVAKVTYDQLINYMNDCADIIEKQGGMTARCFNDFVCYNRRTDCNLYKTVQVCYWSNQWNGSEYNTPDAIKNAGYKMINTNQKWYFVPSKADEYGKSVVLNNFTKFDVTKYQNIKSGYNSTSTTYTEIPVGTTNVGAMFCVWCDTPSVDVALADVQDLIAAMADANPNYFTKGTTPIEPDPVIQDGDGNKGIFEIIINAILRIFLPEGTTATWTVTQGADVVELISDNAAAAQALNTQAAAIRGNSVQVKALKAGTATITATLDNGKTVNATVTVQDSKEQTITVTVGGEYKVPVDGNVSGIYITNDESIASVTAEHQQSSGEPYYESATLGAGKFYISSVANDSNPTTEITFEAAENGTYYIKNSSGKYIYLSASYSWNSWSYSLREVISRNKAQTVTITEMNGAIVVSRNVSDSRNVSEQYWGDTIHTTAYLTLSGNTFGASGTSTNLYLYEKKPGQAIDQTILTFTGHKVGTTTVVIGGVTYTINVVKEDLSKVTLPVNLWITNTGVVPTGWSNGTPSEFTYSDTDGNRRSIYTLKANYPSVNTADGIALSSILPANSGTAKSWDGNTYDVVYWKSAYHTAENRQSTNGWTNNSHLGTAFTYIRYWDGSWAYSIDGIEWVNISNVGAAAADTIKNQVNIWYRQKTTITTEVETQIVDWGPVDYSANQCLLDFAVKYESGQRVPSTFPVSGKTMGFDCPTDQSVPLGNGYVVKDTDGTYYRTVYGIAGVETAEYEVYMITVTPSSDVHTAYITKGTKPTSYPYGGTEKIAWAKTENDANNSELSTISTVKYGGEPFLESVKIYQYQGLLVTYYVRAKQTDDSLTVHYIDETDNNKEFYSYNIAVKSGTYFGQYISLPETTIDGITSLTDGKVINKHNSAQYVSSDLSTMPEIGAKYRYVEYECVRVERRDNKNVYLYYTFKNSVTFVADFGLPIEITRESINARLAETGVTITDITFTNPKYGKIIINGDVVTYKPDKTIDGRDEFSLTYTGNIPKGDTIQSGSVAYVITILPASNVLYEESFFTQTTGWITEGTADTIRTQQAAKLGDVANNSASVYGYDDAYKNDSMYSGGSALKAEVKVSSTDVTAPASFTFTGTGFDIISECGLNTGMLFVRVTQNGEYVKSYLVDTFFKGDTQEIMTEGTMTYQIPVVRNTELAHGTYTVTVYGALYRSSGAVKNAAAANAVYGLDAVNNDADGLYAMLAQLGVSDEELSNLEFVYMDENSVLNGGSDAQPVYDSEIGLFSTYANEEMDSMYYVYLDGFRVYNPLGLDSNGTSSQYSGDNESGFKYKPVLGMLVEGNIGAESGINNCFYVEGDGSKKVTLDVDDITSYQQKGPQNEVYLAPNTAIAFKLDNVSENSIQISAKAVAGTPATLNDTAIQSCTEMYYSITKSGGYFVVTNKGTGVLSISELKVPVNTATQALTDEDKEGAIDAINAVLFSAPVDPVDPEPEPEPEPEIFEPQLLKAYAPAVALRRWGATITVTSSIEEGMEVYIRDENGESMKLTPNNTRMVRLGLADTYRYSFNTGRLAAGTHTYYVYAVKDGLESAPVAVTFTVW